METITKRFIKTTAEEIGETPDLFLETEWWYDTKRPDKKQKYIAVETYKGKDPNDFIKCTDMRLLFTDQAEYYCVCRACFIVYNNMQWTGGTRARAGWRERACDNLKKHEETKGWCEFCDPIFGK